MHGVRSTREHQTQRDWGQVRSYRNPHNFSAVLRTYCTYSATGKGGSTNFFSAVDAVLQYSRQAAHLGCRVFFAGMGRGEGRPLRQTDGTASILLQASKQASNCVSYYGAVINCALYALRTENFSEHVSTDILRIFISKWDVEAFLIYSRDLPLPKWETTLTFHFPWANSAQVQTDWLHSILIIYQSVWIFELFPSCTLFHCRVPSQVDTEKAKLSLAMWLPKCAGVRSN